MSTTRERSGDDKWSIWNHWIAARLFHVVTKDPQFDAPSAKKPLPPVAPPFPRPPLTKRVRGRLLKLANPVKDSEFTSVLLRRRTWRAFARKPVPFGELSTLLNLTTGVQAWATTITEGRVALKTSPSGGSRHPIEAYIAAINCRGVPSGLYHYSADRHGLVRIASIKRTEIRALLPQQPWYASAGAVVFFTVFVPRTMWRYPYARAYRALLIEAGHVCQTFCLTATWLGLAPFCTMALADSAIERKLEIDGIHEIVLYAAGVGCRPRGADWAPRANMEPRVLTRHILRGHPHDRSVS